MYRFCPLKNFLLVKIFIGFDFLICKRKNSRIFAILYVCIFNKAVDKGIQRWISVRKALIASWGICQLKISQHWRDNSFRFRRGKYPVKNEKKGQLAFSQSQQKLVKSGIRFRSLQFSAVKLFFCSKIFS